VPTALSLMSSEAVAAAELPSTSQKETKSSSLWAVRGLSLPPSFPSVSSSHLTRGVAALHSLSSQIVHRDIKSFNFLGSSFSLPL
jgi:hypothetical protein